MDWLVRFIPIACWIEIISMHVNAQQALSLKPFHGSDWQNWDELDLQTRLSSRLDATWVAQGRFSSRLSNPAVGVLGGGFHFEGFKPARYHPLLLLLCISYCLWRGGPPTRSHLGSYCARQLSSANPIRSQSFHRSARNYRLRFSNGKTTTPFGTG